MIASKRVAISAAFGIILGTFLLNIYESGICSKGFCSDFIEDVAGAFVFFYSVPLLLLSSVLIFVHKEIFNTWWKFARIYIPLSAILTILSGSGRGGGYIGLTSDYESTIWFTASLFLIISISIIAYKFIRLRKNTGV